MKKFLLFVLLLGIAGGGYYYFRHRQAVRLAAEKQRQEELAAQARTAAEAEARAKAKAAEEARIKAELAARAKAEAEARKRQEELAAKAKAEAEAAKPENHLAALRKQYLETEPVWNPFKVQLQRLRLAASQSASQQDFDPSVKARAQALSRTVQTYTERALATAKGMEAAQVAQKRASTSLMGGGGRKDKYSAWYYVDSPKNLYPMSEIKKRSRKRRIAYVSNKDNLRNSAVEAEAKKYAAFKQEHEDCVRRKTEAEKELAVVQQSLQQRIAAEQTKVRQAAAAIIARRKKLRDDIKGLEKTINAEGGTVIAAQTAAGPGE